MSERKVLARGTVLVDPRKAVEKLRAFKLAQPGLYVLEVVRAAGERRHAGSERGR